VAQERRPRVARTAVYDNDEDTLRSEFGTDTELEELEAPRGLGDIGGGHS